MVEIQCVANRDSHLSILSIASFNKKSIISDIGLRKSAGTLEKTTISKPCRFSRLCGIFSGHARMTTTPAETAAILKSSNFWPVYRAAQTFCCSIQHNLAHLLTKVLLWRFDWVPALLNRTARPESWFQEVSSSLLNRSNVNLVMLVVMDLGHSLKQLVSARHPVS